MQQQQQQQQLQQEQEHVQVLPPPPIESSKVVPPATTVSAAASASASASQSKMKKRHHNEQHQYKNQNSTISNSETSSFNNNTSTTTATTETPITIDGERPLKRFYRQRAHCNPLAHNDTYDYPTTPQKMNWCHNTQLYPEPISTETTATTETTTIITNTYVHPPTILDIGCGFGGLTLALASILSTENICGIEIRAKVTEYVRLRILAARNNKTYCINPNAIQSLLSSNTIPISSSLSSDTTNPINLPALIPVAVATATATMTSTSSSINDDQATSLPLDSSTLQQQQQQQHHYNNCAVIRTNSMKFLPNYFVPHSINKVFFCFPDPHFKRKNFSRRIISYRLLDEYAYILKQSSSSSITTTTTTTTNKEQNTITNHTSSTYNNNDTDHGVVGGLLYAITDVKELHEWHIAACNEHPLFQKVYIGQQQSVRIISQQQQRMDDEDNVTIGNKATASSSSTTTATTTFNEDDDPCIYAMKYLTEEGQKVDRNYGTKYYMIYQCIQSNSSNKKNTIHAGNFFLSK